MRDYIFSVFIFVDSRDSLMSFIQDNSFSLGENTCNDQVWMTHPMHVLCYARRTSTDNLRGKRRLSVLSVSEF